MKRYVVEGNIKFYTTVKNQSEAQYKLKKLEIDINKSILTDSSEVCKVDYITSSKLEF